MLYSLSKQIAHCYFRAAESRKLADLCVSAAERRFYIEREQAWLTLARSHEFSDRIGQWLKELERWQKGYLPPPPQCPNCRINMQFKVSHPAKRTLVGITYEQVFFVCPNCQRVSDQLVATPRDASTYPR